MSFILHTGYCRRIILKQQEYQVLQLPLHSYIAVDNTFVSLIFSAFNVLFAFAVFVPSAAALY